MAKQFVKISSVRGKQGGSAGCESIKVASFQKVRFVCQISKKKFQITILNLKFEFPSQNSKQFTWITGKSFSESLILESVNQ